MNANTPYILSNAIVFNFLVEFHIGRDHAADGLQKHHAVFQSSFKSHLKG
jgi:hypothetical protein